MTFFKSMTFKIAFIALASGLTLGTSACSKKTFTSVGTENVDQGTNANANGGNATSGDINTTNNTTNNNNVNNNTGNNNGNTTNVTGNNNGTGNNVNNGTGNGNTTSAVTNTTNGNTTTANTNTANGTTNTTNNGSNTAGNVNGPQPNPQYCLTEKYTQPKAVIIKKLDVLILTDSSTSMDAERAALANGISNFIAQLPSDTDVRFAVMLAHGATSWFSGRLYKSDFKDPREKYVLSNQNMNVATLQKWMNRKLRYRIKEVHKYGVRGFKDEADFTKFDPAVVELGLPQDYDAGGGEGGIYSMYQAFKTWPVEATACPAGGPCRYTSIQNLATDIPGELGFFRNDAALSIINISDENDLCYPDNTGRDDSKNELPFYNNYCKNWSQPADSLLQRIQVLRQSLPLYVSSIIYNSAGFPPGAPGLENGIGYGYNRMAQLANGTIIDMKNGSGVIAPGLSNIGTHNSTMMNLRHDFILKYKHVDSTTILAKADAGGNGAFVTKPHTYSSTTNTVYLADAGTASSKVHIKYCLQKDAALDPYEIQISSFLRNASLPTYKPDVVVETK